jgi:precorrin-6B C5,15-methyltransferase / cobalt-precorrin-6B C5,C15-methyltransferase
MKKIVIIGISDAGLGLLPETSRTLLREATLLVGGERHLEFLPESKAERIVLGSNLKEMALRLEAELRKAESRVVVLASGDPLFYGIARYLIKNLGADKVEVRPYLSSMQLAFARAGLSWEDAQFLSVHGRPIENLIGVSPDAKKIGIFTDKDNTPARCADFLASLGWEPSAPAWVCENLEGPKERITTTTLEALAGKVFSELNVLIVERASAPDPHLAYSFGLADDAFAQRKPERGLITKSEIRAISLSKMRIFPGACIWDLGAATGSVAIEAARLSGKGHVWAVEKNAEDCENIAENVARFHTPQVRILHGLAPLALEQIPAEDDPDAVFIGGSSGKMSDILELCQKRLKVGGSLVMNTVTLENQAEALQWLKKSGMDWDFIQVQVSRRKPILELNRFDALNPITIFWGTKK